VIGSDRLFVDLPQGVKVDFGAHGAAVQTQFLRHLRLVAHRCIKERAVIPQKIVRVEGAGENARGDVLPRGVHCSSWGMRFKSFCICLMKSVDSRVMETARRRPAGVSW